MFRIVQISEDVRFHQRNQVLLYFIYKKSVLILFQIYFKICRTSSNNTSSRLLILFLYKGGIVTHYVAYYILYIDLNKNAPYNCKAQIP